jgi:hypothetical protein
MTEQTDAVVVVVSEESGQISLVERARIVRNLDEPRLARDIAHLLHPQTASGVFQDRTPPRRVGPTVRELARRARLGGLNRLGGRAGRADRPRAAAPSDEIEGQEKAS